MKRAQEFDDLEEEDIRQEYLQSLRSKREPAHHKGTTAVKTVVQKVSRPTSKKPLQYGLTVPRRREVIMEYDAKPLLHKQGDSREPEKVQLQSDISKMPETASLECYYKNPIEEFGKAMLRGMGWRQGKPIGKNPNGIVEPIKFESRPSLLGLGAKPVEIEEPKKKTIRPGDQLSVKSVLVEQYIPPPRTQRELKEYQIGDSVIIISGTKRNRSGKIENIKYRKDGVAIYLKCQNTNEILAVWDNEIEVKSWLRPRIRVRIIDKFLGNGKFFGMKCIIKDVPRPRVCTVVSLDGKVIDNMKQNHLETVVPKLERTVMVLDHPDKILVGQLGQLLHCDDKNEMGTIRMEQTYDMETISYNDFSEYCENLH